MIKAVHWSMPTLHERVLALERTALRHEAKMEKHDKQIAATRALLQEGARIVRWLAKDQRELHASLKELGNSLKRGANGHGKRKLDIQ